MIHVSPEQVLGELKQNGSYAAMRQEMLKVFSESERGKELEKDIAALVERASASGDGEAPMRGRNRDENLERRIAGYLERHGRLERLETDARNYWLKGDKKEAMRRSISEATDRVSKTDNPSRLRQRVSRALELEPPRLPSHGSGAPARSHSFYRIGDAAAAFVPIGNAFLNSSPRYTCVSVTIESCDAPKNMYMVRDPDAAHQGPLQEVWAVFWDQLIALKRPYDHKHREGDQVYALYRNDLGEGTAVSTEFFPGRVERVSQMSIAVRFDTGELAHVYYDELFAAGRVGFLRQQSEERKRRCASDAMVEVHGRFIPSFTGFWPSIAQPGLGKHGRKTRYRQMPPLLVDERSADKYYLQTQLQDIRNETDGAVCESDKNSDMDTGSSSTAPESPAPKPMVVDAQPKQKQQQQLDTRDAAPDHSSNQASVPAKQAQPVSSEEDGEIDVEPNEEGECVEDRHPPSSPRARDSSSSSHRRYSDYHHRSARRQSSHSRADYYYQQGSRHDRPPSRGRTSRYDDRERSPYSRHSRDEWGSGRRSSGYRDSGYRDRRRSRSRSRSRGRGRADPYGRADSYGRADPYGSSPMHVAQLPLPPPAPQHQLRMAPDGIMISPPHQPPPPPVAINPFQLVDFGSPMPQQQNRMDVCDDDHYPYQHPRQHDRRHDDYRYQR